MMSYTGPKAPRTDLMDGLATAGLLYVNLGADPMRVRLAQDVEDARLAFERERASLRMAPKTAEYEPFLDEQDEAIQPYLAAEREYRRAQDALRRYDRRQGEAFLPVEGGR